MASETPFSKSPAQNVDRLSISNLHLDNGILAPYVFGERKQQPATVSISLDLSQGFSSAASTDALDQNTVHYGNLAKAVRDKRPGGQTLENLIDWIEGAVDRMGERKDGSSRVGRCMVSVRLPKASMAGECVEVTSERIGRGGRVVKVGFEGVRIMVLIGVNAVERTAKQALEVDLEISCRGDEALREDVKAFGLEREVIGVCFGFSGTFIYKYGTDEYLDRRANEIRDAGVIGRAYRQISAAEDSGDAAFVLHDELEDEEAESYCVRGSACCESDKGVSPSR